VAAAQPAQFTRGPLAKHPAAGQARRPPSRPLTHPPTHPSPRRPPLPAAAAAAAVPQTAHTPSGATVAIDDWLIDFANLFRDTSGLDADRHIDFHNSGWDATTRAMDAATAAGEASELLDAASEQFRDVTCTGLLNW
jgi:hypothetical protein